MKTIYFKYKFIKGDALFVYGIHASRRDFVIPISKSSRDVKLYNEVGFFNLLIELPDTEIENFLNFHYDEFEGGKNVFLIYFEDLINKSESKWQNICFFESYPEMDENKVHYSIKRIANEFVGENYVKETIIMNWIKEKKHKPNEPKTNPKPNKMKWNGKPSHLTYILKNLTVNIELPPEIVNNKSKTAEYFLNFFEVNKPDSFIRLYQNDNLPTHAIKQDLNKVFVDPSSKEE